MAPDVSVSGAHWLERITFDALCHIVWFLDVRSISRLALSCSALRGAISGSKAIWLRVLRIVSDEQSIAPYSFANLTSVEELRAAATRSLRIRAALANHTLPLALRVERIFLDHSGIIGSARIDYSRFTSLTLLPGGRWLLSLANHADSSYVICWDTHRKTFVGDHAVHATHYSLQPTAHLELRGLRADRSLESIPWAEVQATDEADGAIIALRVIDKDTGTRVHQIIQLKWSAQDPTPVFLRRARLDNDTEYLPDLGDHPYTLEGDYLVFDSYDGIFIWNWKNDTVCTMLDRKRREWADETGFHISIQPPVIYAFPTKLRRIVIIPIPPLVPRGSYTGHTTPVGTVTYLFLHRSMWAHGSATPISLNLWQPSRSRPGIDVLAADVEGCDYIIRFSSAEALSESLHCAEQPHHQFYRLSPLSFNMVQADGNVLACQRHFAMPTDELIVHAFPLHPDGHFLPSHSRAFTINELGWPLRRNTLGPICPVSGSVLLTKVGNRGSGRMHLLDSICMSIASFD